MTVSKVNDYNGQGSIVWKWQNLLYSAGKEPDKTLRKLKIK